MKKLSAVVAGTGIATAIGLTEEETLRSLVSGKAGIRLLEDYTFRGAGLPAGYCDIERIKHYLAEQGVHVLEEDSRSVLLAFYVVHQALHKAASRTPGKRPGLYVGSSLTANDTLARNFQASFSGKRNPPSAIVECANYYLTARLSTEFNFDTCTTISSSCASGLQCVGFAMRDLALGIVDDAVVVGVDSALNKSLIDTWMSARVLSKMDPPETAARPFCRTRRGFVYGEGAACVVMRKADEAPLLEIIGVHSDFGSENFFAVTEKDMVRCMEGVLSDSGLAPGQIDFIHANANGSRQGDLEEARAINRVFGRGVPVYSSKALYGNTHGAQGINNLIHAMLIMQHGPLPTNPHIFEEDPEIAELINCGYRNGQYFDLKAGLLNTFGFCGMNASVIFRKL